MPIPQAFRISPSTYDLYGGEYNVSPENRRNFVERDLVFGGPELTQSLSIRPMSLSWYSFLFNIDAYAIDLSNAEFVAALRRPGIGKLWVKQLNAAVWMATAGCGVSFSNLNYTDNPTIAAFYRFHVIHQIFAILYQLQCKTPRDAGFDRKNNPHNATVYARLRSEFGIQPTYAWEYTLSEKSAEAQKYGFVYGIPLDTSGFSGGFTAAGIARLNTSIRHFMAIMWGAQNETETPFNYPGDAVKMKATEQFFYYSRAGYGTVTDRHSI